MPAASRPAPPAASEGRAWGLALVALGIVLLRWRLLDVPLERDEGEYAYGGRLLASGVWPYVGFYNMKLPGIYAVYAAVMAAFGESVRGVHLGLAVADAASAVLLGLWVRGLAGAAAGTVAAAVFGLLALLPSVQGTSANAEHFVLPFALAALWQATRAAETGRLARAVLAGLLAGTAFLVKQHGLVFAALGLALALLPPATAPRARRAKHAAAYLAALAAPWIATAVTYAAAGHWEDLRLWTIEYAGLYASEAPLEGALARFGDKALPLLADAPVAWAAALAGAALLGAGRHGPRARWALAAFALCGAVAVVPGLYFRPHYFVFVLPPAAALAGVAVASVRGGRARAALGLGLVLATLLPHSRYLFRTPPEEITRSLYGSNPFVESEPVAEHIAANTAPADTVAVLGSEPQILFLAGRRGATGFLYTYPLMEGHALAGRMQERWIAEVEAADPAYLVYVHHPLSWLQRRDSDRSILRWFARQQDEYPRVARYLIAGPASRWAEGAELAKPLGPGFFSIDLHRRRP